MGSGAKVSANPSIVCERGKVEYIFRRRWYIRLFLSIVAACFLLVLGVVAAQDHVPLWDPVFWWAGVLPALFLMGMALFSKDDHWIISIEQRDLVVQRHNLEVRFPFPVEVLHDLTADHDPLVIRTRGQYIEWMGNPQYRFLEVLSSFLDEAGVPYREVREGGEIPRRLTHFLAYARQAGRRNRPRTP